MKKSSNSDDFKRSTEGLISNYENFFKTAPSGMWHKSTIQKLIGRLGISGREKTTKQFWKRRRDDVSTTLVELRLFLDSAPQKSINQVFSVNTIRPIFDSLFWGKRWILHDTEPELEKAKIAQWMIAIGFQYLTFWKPDNITKSHQRTLEEAIDLSKFLLADFSSELDYSTTWLKEESES